MWRQCTCSARRCMLPRLQVRVAGLDAGAAYAMLVDFVPCDEKGYRCSSHKCSCHSAAAGARSFSSWETCSAPAFRISLWTCLVVNVEQCSSSVVSLLSNRRRQRERFGAGARARRLARRRRALDVRRRTLRRAPADQQLAARRQRARALLHLLLTLHYNICILEKARVVPRAQIFLNTRHRYQPRVHVVLVAPDADAGAGAGGGGGGGGPGERVAADWRARLAPGHPLARTFAFPETRFVALTHYKNPRVRCAPSRCFSRGLTHTHTHTEAAAALGHSPVTLWSTRTALV